MSPRQLCADDRPTHSFRSPIKNITWRRGQPVLLPDERVKCVLEKSINGFVIKPAIEHVSHPSDIETAPDTIVKDISQDGPHLRVYNEDRTELFTIDKNGNILMRQPTRYLHQKQSLLPSTAEEALLQGSIQTMHEARKGKEKVQPVRKAEAKENSPENNDKISFLEANVWDFPSQEDEFEIPNKIEGKVVDKQLRHLQHEGRNFRANRQ